MAASRVPALQQFQLTNPQLKVVEGVFVDLPDAFVQCNGKVSQRAQMAPLVFTLLQWWWEEDKKKNENTARRSFCIQQASHLQHFTCFSGDRPETAM